MGKPEEINPDVRCTVFLDPLVKPPCVRCGQPSEGWMDNDGYIGRVCRACGETLQELCYGFQLHELHLLVCDASGNYQHLVWLIDEWVDFDEWTGNQLPKEIKTEGEGNG